MRAIVARWERHQVLLFLVSIGVGVGGGLLLPSAAAHLESVIIPALGALLFATFLAVPFTAIGRGFADGRFIGVVLALNFLVVPVVVFCLSRVVAADRALLVGVLLVLLTPCVDYVIVFAGLAGGDRTRLLAVTPVLMLLQLVLLPPLLWLFAGPDAAAAFDPQPFLVAFLLLIVLPLALAFLTQLLARRYAAARAVENAGSAAMVPLMMLTLAAVVGSQVSAIGDELTDVLITIPIFLAFAVIMAVIGTMLSRTAQLDVPGRRAAVFSGVTRNSLVVLPLALALPEPFALAPLVVVTQTLVELAVMVTMVALVPRLIRR